VKRSMASPFFTRALFFIFLLYSREIMGLSVGGNSFPNLPTVLAKMPRRHSAVKYMKELTSIPILGFDVQTIVNRVSEHGVTSRLEES